ncbi:MAG: hypothetical protein ACHQ06_05995 [Candidatus Dormibacteria bacterium]
MNGDQLYELAQIREQEFMLEATLRRANRQRSRSRTIGLVAGAARRLRRHGDSNQA